MSDELTEFTDKLGAETSPTRARGRNGQPATEACSPSDSRREVDSADTVQWAVLGNGVFRPCGSTRPILPSGVYGIGADNAGLYLTAKRIVTDDLIVLPDTASERVLTALQVFWDAKAKFADKGQLFKRGVMLWGPPGSGKTCTLMLLTQDIIKRGAASWCCPQAQS